MKKPPYSHKYEILEFLRPLHSKAAEHKKARNVVISNIENAQTFRLPCDGVLPEVKGYCKFYDFMISPYDNYLIEIPCPNGWVVFQVNAYEITGTRDRSLGCSIFNKYKGSWDILGSLRIDMTPDNYKLKTDISDLPNGDAGMFSWRVFEFLVAVNTPNIKQITTNAPKLINKKRRAKGKTPLEGYKYLDLCEKIISPNEVQSGEYAKKRMHWRRGHIRRLEDKTIWVRPALIGTGNLVGKTYRLKRRQGLDTKTKQA